MIITVKVYSPQQLHSVAYVAVILENSVVNRFQTAFLEVRPF